MLFLRSQCFSLLVVVEEEASMQVFYRSICSQSPPPFLDVSISARPRYFRPHFSREIFADSFWILGCQMWRRLPRPHLQLQHKNRVGAKPVGSRVRYRRHFLNEVSAFGSKIDLESTNQRACPCTLMCEGCRGEEREKAADSTRRYLRFPKFTNRRDLTRA